MRYSWNLMTRIPKKKSFPNTAFPHLTHLIQLISSLGTVRPEMVVPINGDSRQRQMGASRTGLESTTI